MSVDSQRENLMVCKVFLSRYPPKMMGTIEKLLPPSEQAAFAELPASMPLDTAERIKGDPLHEIHPSWLAPYLRTLSETDLRLFLSSLTADQRKKLEKTLGFENHLPELGRAAKKYFRKTLLDQVTQNQKLIPMGFLPDHPLNHLLHLTPAKLENAVRFLGLHDLSFEMRQIIATKVLKSIFTALPKKEGEYLQMLLLQREPLVFQRLFLEKWDGSKENMDKLLLERGAERLSNALFSCSASLKWYVTHKLSMRIGTLVLKHTDKPTHARADQILTQQIEKIIKQLDSHEAV